MNNASQRKPNPDPQRERARLAVLAQWRGVDLAPEEIASSSRARSAAAIMPQALREIGLDQRRLEAEVARVWNHLIDPNIVEHAQPRALHKGTLFVTVDSSVWLNEIVRYRREEILERLQNSFGREFIQRISFKAG